VTALTKRDSAGNRIKPFRFLLGKSRQSDTYSAGDQKQDVNMAARMAPDSCDMAAAQSGCPFAQPRTIS
jgi:hypothetical protein